MKRANNSHDGFESYALKQKLIKERGRKCQQCNSAERIEMHHEPSVKDSNENTIFDFFLLCHKCHKAKTQDHKIIDIWIKRGVKIF